MLVLFDFLSRHIVPLQMRVCPAWQYIGEGETTWLERGHGSGLSLGVLSALFGKLTPDPSSADFVTPLLGCSPVCSNQLTWTRLLSELPMLDDIGITVQQKGHESRGVQIPEMDTACNAPCYGSPNPSLITIIRLSHALHAVVNK
jgi:hypothetical protein